eukprot:COSAG05_NODE_2312_length_3243_cov_2.859097_2_plen_56_part_00
MCVCVCVCVAVAQENFGVGWMAGIINGIVITIFNAGYPHRCPHLSEFHVCHHTKP